MKIKWQLFWFGFSMTLILSIFWFWVLWMQGFSMYVCTEISTLVYILIAPYSFLMWWVIPEEEWRKYK